MELTSELRNRLIKQVEYYVGVANKQLGITMRPLTIRFDKRGTTAGTARYATNTVDFNAGLYVRNVDAFLNDTVPHEVAHIAANLYHNARGYRGRVQPHGDTWKMVMRTFGVKPSRCHSFDTSETKIKRNVTTYTYHCACQQHELSAKMHSQIQSGRGRHCKKCKASVKLGPLVPRDTKTVPTMPGFMISAAVRAPQPPVVRSAAPAPYSVPKAGSKKDRAEALYLNHKATADRATMIAIFVNELCMTPAGASTYYSNCKKSFG